MLYIFIFLSWDTDLDLDFLLGEYTEDEKDDSGSELDDYVCIDSCDRRKTVNIDKSKIVVSFGMIFMLRV